MKVFALFSAVLGVLVAGCGDSSSSKSPAATNAPAKYDTGNPVTAVPDYAGAVVQAQKSMIKTIDTSALTQAIQQFNIAEERFPTNLNELVEKKYIAKIPDAPYGYKIVYTATDGSVKVVKQ